MIDFDSEYISILPNLNGLGLRPKGFDPTRRVQRSGLEKPKQTHMKLRQNGIVSFLIRLADFQASGVARMKLHEIKKRTAEY